MAHVPDRLAAKDLSYSYRERIVLRGVDLAIEQGEVVSLLGPNGAGKSTLLRLMLGIEAPPKGEVRLNGIKLQHWDRRKLAQQLAYVPQAHVSPFPYLVRDIVMMGRLAKNGIFGVASSNDRAVVGELIGKLRIGHLADRPYTQISGGERQLTLIARALAQGAHILIMDEPTNGLDYGNQIRLIERLQSLAESGYAVLLTTHHPEHASILSTRVALLHDGMIIADGPPDKTITPDTIRQLYDVETIAAKTALGSQVLVPKIAARTTKTSSDAKAS